MADTKISALAAGAPAQAGDLIPIARGGANYSITPANILQYNGTQAQVPSITFGSSTAGIIGTTTNDAAAAGSVGEYVSSSVAPGSAVTVATINTAQDVTTISLTAGDWLVSINGAIQSAGTVTTRLFFWIGTTAGNSTAEANASTYADFNYALPVNATIPGAVPSHRMSLSGTTTVRFKVQSTFTGTNPAVSGRISATRVR